MKAKTIRLTEIPHSYQEDSSSCGVFIMKFAACYLRGQAMTFSTDVASIWKYRQCCWHDILDFADPSKNGLCRVCGFIECPRRYGTKDRWVSLKYINMYDTFVYLHLCIVITIDKFENYLYYAGYQIFLRGYIRNFYFMLYYDLVSCN